MSGKLIIKQHSRTEMDTVTGEVRTISQEQVIGLTEKEPDYIKIYIGTQLCLNSIDPGLAPAIVAFGSYMSYADDSQFTHMIKTDEMCKESVAKALGVTPRRVTQIIKKLVDVGIFIPVMKTIVDNDGVVSQKKRRGVYFVNPYIIGRGAWKDIKKLRQQIDWSAGTASYLIEDELGQRDIHIALPQQAELRGLEDADGQED